MSKGRLAFRFRGGPETIALVDLPKSTQSGIVDFSICLAGVVESVAPGVGATILSRISVAEERKNGTYAYMDQLMNKGGLHYMGRHSPANDLQFFQLFMNKKVEKIEDFKKLRIGTATAARALTEAWGAAPVNLQLTDYYTAMERNTVDGVSSSTSVELGQFRLSVCNQISGPAGISSGIPHHFDEPEDLAEASAGPAAGDHRRDDLQRENQR